MSTDDPDLDRVSEPGEPETPSPPSEPGESETPSPPAGQDQSRSDGWKQTVLHLALIVPLALAMFLFRLGTADYKGGSGSNGGQTVQEIVNGPDWILPLRNGEHIPVKPPLFYWLGALSATVRQTGGDILDSRLPSAVLGTLCIVAVYFFTRRLAGGSVALWAALILTTTPQFLTESRNSRVDIALCLFVTAGLFLAHRVWEGEGGRRTALLAGLCFGLGILSKGPLALGLGVLVFAATALVARPAPGWRALISPTTVAVIIGLPALWYAAAAAQGGAEFLRIHFYVENASRLWGEQGRWSAWFYLEPFLTAGLPWMLALPWVVVGASALPPRARRFLWAWVVAMFVLFTLSAGKRRAYLLPLRPALAILVAAWLVPQLARLRPLRRRVRPPGAVEVVVGTLAFAGLACVLALSMGVGGFGAAEEEWSYWWRQFLQAHMITAAALVIGLGVGIDLIVHALWQRRFDLAAYALTGTVAWGLTIGVSSAAIVRGEGASFRPLAQQLAAHGFATQPLAFFDLDDDDAIGLLFHLRRHIPVVRPEDATAPCTPPAAGLYLVTESHWNATPCFRDDRWRELLRGGPPVRSQRHGRLVLGRYAQREPEPVTPDAPRE